MVTVAVSRADRAKLSLSGVRLVRPVPWLSSVASMLSMRSCTLDRPLPCRLACSWPQPGPAFWPGPARLLDWDLGEGEQVSTTYIVNWSSSMQSG